MNTDKTPTKHTAIPLDADQHAAATSLENTVVVAGAGSGKTTVLASRVIYLMLHQNIPISEILILTFTRKGAAEMHHRIKVFLERTIETQSFLGQRLHDEQITFLTEQLALYYNAQISTIDSFSYRIAQSVFLRLGYIAPLQLTNNMYHIINSFITQWMISHQESILHTLLQQYSINTVQQDILIPFLSEIGLTEDTPVPDFETVFQSLCVYHTNMTTIFREKLEKLYIEVCNISDAHTKSDSYQKYVEALKNIIQVIKNMEEEMKSDAIAQNMEAYTTMIGILNDITIRFPSSKEGAFDHLKETHEILKYRQKQYLPRCKAFIELAHHKSYFEAVYHELHILAKDWLRHRREHLNVCSFYDIATLAFHGLNKYHDIQQLFSEQYKCIIIDEFQDNNFMQKKLLYMFSHIVDSDTGNTNNTIIEKQKYFFVGDPKQSIYGFRGSEVGSFLELHHEMDTCLSLQNNYRSTPQLIALFNACFQTLFSNEELNASHPTLIQSSDKGPFKITYEQQISPHSNTTNKPSLSDTHTACECFVLEYTKDDSQVFSKHEIEAFYIAQTTQHLVIKDKVPAKDIAILLRTKTLYPYLQKFLMQMNIPYTISEATTLHKDIGYDFYSWLRLLIYPEDRSAYAAILRSPIVRISDTAVIQLLLQHKSPLQLLKERTPETPLFSDTPALRDEIISDIPKINALLTKYQEARQLLKEKTMVDVLDHFWLECGYRYLLLSQKKYHPFLEQYHVLKTMISSQRQSGAVELLTMLETIVSGDTNGLQNEYEDITVLSPNKTDGVHIMTIHKAKGLEFPVVILGYMGAQFRTSNVPKYKKIDAIPFIDVLSPTSPHRFLIGKGEQNIHTSFYYALYDQSRLDLSEELRLLYVAMTRAKQKLYLVGTQEQQEQDEKSYSTAMDKKNYLGWFNVFRDEHTNKITLPHFKEHHIDASVIVQALRRANDDLSNTITSSVHPCTCIEQELEQAHEITYEERIIEISPSNSVQEHADNIIKPEAERLPDPECASVLRKYELYTTFGTYCHYILSKCCNGTLPEHVVPHLALEKQLLPLDDAEKTLFMNSAKTLCNGFLDSELYNSLSSDAQIFPEHAFLIWNNTHQTWMRGIIDLLIQEQNRVIIVDYKVDWHKSPADYDLQIAAYKLAARILLGMDTTEHIAGYLFYLRSKEAIEHTAQYDDDTLFQILKQKQYSASV